MLLQVAMMWVLHLAVLGWVDCCVLILVVCFVGLMFL